MDIVGVFRIVLKLVVLNSLSISATGTIPLVETNLRNRFKVFSRSSAMAITNILSTSSTFTVCSISSRIALTLPSCPVTPASSLTTASTLSSLATPTHSPIYTTYSMQAPFITMLSTYTWLLLGRTMPSWSRIMSGGNRMTTRPNDFDRKPSQMEMGGRVGSFDRVVRATVKERGGRQMKQSTILGFRLLRVPTITYPSGDGAPGCWSNRNIGYITFLVAMELISPQNTAVSTLTLSLRYLLTWLGSTPLNLYESIATFLRVILQRQKFEGEPIRDNWIRAFFFMVVFRRRIVGLPSMTGQLGRPQHNSLSNQLGFDYFGFFYINLTSNYSELFGLKTSYGD